MPTRSAPCRIILLAALLAAITCEPALGRASSTTPPAVTNDPPRDAANPATMYQLEIPTHGVRMFGVFYRAAGAGSHPTVLLLHGLPGYEQNTDLAHAIRRAGWNALIFHYRGSWGSGGTFSFTNCIEDVQTVLAYLRDSGNAAKLGVDPARLVLIGHSMGGFMAGFSAAQDQAVLGAVLISAWNPGTLATRASEQLDHTMLEEFRSDVGPLAGATPEGLLAEAKRHAAEWDLVARAASWKSRPILILESDDFLHEDDVEVAAALRKLESAQLSETHLVTDHGYSDRRIALQVALLQWLRQFEPPRAPKTL